MAKKLRKGSAVVVEREGELLLVQSGKKVIYGKWVIPGGGVEPGETVQEAGQREIGEETGLEVDVTDEVLHEEFIPGEEEDRKVHFSHGIYLSGEPVPSDELLDAKFLSRTEIAALHKEGLLTETMERALEALGWLVVRER